MAFLKEDPDKVLPYLEKSDIQISRKGYECENYEERKVVPLTMRWLEERNHIWDNVSLVVAEKTIVPQKHTEDFDSISQQQRACLCVEMTMRTWFRMKFASGGPLFVVKTAGWWQDANGFIVGEFKHMRRDLAYKELKKRSVTALADSPVGRLNPTLVNDLHTEYGDKLDDLAEAYWIVRAAYQNRQRLYEEALTDDTYTHTISFANNGIHRKRIPPLVYKDIGTKRKVEKGMNDLFDAAPVNKHWMRTEERRNERASKRQPEVKHKPYPYKKR